MAYQYFYQYYDKLMNDIPYDKFINLLQTYLKTTDKILDLGCGTGTVLLELLKLGYNVDGLDISDKMLIATQNKLNQHNLQTNLYHDDMQNIKITEEYNVIFCFLDSINYLTSKKALEQSFTNIYKALKVEGYFIFDVHSLKKVKTIFDGYSYGENFSNFSYIWNTYVENKPEYSLLDHELTFFIKDKSNKYFRLDEVHQQVIFKKEIYQKLLENVNFKIEKMLYDLEGNNCQVSDDRIIFICKKTG